MPNQVRDQERDGPAHMPELLFHCPTSAAKSLSPAEYSQIPYDLLFRLLASVSSFIACSLSGMTFISCIVTFSGILLEVLILRRTPNIAARRDIIFQLRNGNIYRIIKDDGIDYHSLRKRLRNNRAVGDRKYSVGRRCWIDVQGPKRLTGVPIYGIIHSQSYGEVA